MRLIWIILLVVCFCSTPTTGLSKSDRQKKKNVNHYNEEFGDEDDMTDIEDVDTDEHAVAKELPFWKKHGQVVENQLKRDWTDIKFPPDVVFGEDMLLQESEIDHSEKKFSNPILAYITPWNNRGYDIAKWAAKKFTHISPVWFTVYYDESQGCFVQGQHDIDQGWISDVRSNNTDIKFVPRFEFVQWSKEEVNQFLFNEEQQKSCIGVIRGLVEEQQFDGAVLELWNLFLFLTGGAHKTELSEFVSELGNRLHEKDKEVVVPVPPYEGKSKTPYFTPLDFEQLQGAVDYIQVMTYDFPDGTGIAPLRLVEQSMKILIGEDGRFKEKLLMGLNFYGRALSKQGAETVTRENYLKVIHKPDTSLNWYDETAEHVLFLSESSYVFYPSLSSIEFRVKLAEELGVGLGIWELGQGLNYFTQVL